MIYVHDFLSLEEKMVGDFFIGSPVNDYLRHENTV